MLLLIIISITASKLMLLASLFKLWTFWEMKDKLLSMIFGFECLAEELDMLILTEGSDWIISV